MSPIGIEPAARTKPGTVRAGERAACPQKAKVLPVASGPPGSPRNARTATPRLRAVGAQLQPFAVDLSMGQGDARTQTHPCARLGASSRHALECAGASEMASRRKCRSWAHSSRRRSSFQAETLTSIAPNASQPRLLLSRTPRRAVIVLE